MESQEAKELKVCSNNDNNLYLFLYFCHTAAAFLSHVMENQLNTESWRMLQRKHENESHEVMNVFLFCNSHYHDRFGVLHEKNLEVISYLHYM